MSWRDSVSQTAPAATIADVQQYIALGAVAPESPLDAFYRASQDIVKVATPAFLTANPAMGPLLLVGLVSVTENYFRDLFTKLIRLCPVARAKCADQSIQLGSVIWHGGLDAERGAFEHISFADAKRVVSTTEKFLDYKLKASSILAEFDKVCELRHGIVHSSAVLAGKNAIRLQIASAAGTLRIVVPFAQLQEAASVCTSLVVSINRELFVEMARRWAKEWPKRPSWDPAMSHSLFKSVWTIFHSAIDEANATIPSPMTLMRCKHRVSADPF